MEIRAKEIIFNNKNEIIYMEINPKTLTKTYLNGDLVYIQYADSKLLRRILFNGQIRFSITFDKK